MVGKGIVKMVVLTEFQGPTNSYSRLQARGIGVKSYAFTYIYANNIMATK